MEPNDTNILKTKHRKTVFLALITMLFWGSLYPFIKIGYSTFNINTLAFADILLFAAIRFTFCGIIVCVISLIKKENLKKPEYKSVLRITLMGVFGIVLHYSFTYIGLSLTESSKAAILKQLGVLVYVCFAFLFVKDERFSVYKIIGAIVGFCGIVVINLGAENTGIKMGDILIILASLCTVVSNIMSKGFSNKNSPYWITGISQFTGGIILLIVAIILGGKFPTISFEGVLVFAYICTASIISYTLWYYVQRTSELSHLFIIKFAEPFFACVFGALLLGENILKIHYFVAFVLIASGILLGNRRKNDGECS